jgi:hypothetical protein
MNIWWSKKPEPGNFGDILTPYILNHFGIKHKYADKAQCDTLCVGSIAKFARDGVKVLGSGTARASDILCKDADWRFVRGPYTRQYVLRDGGDCPPVYGDPALLLPLFCEGAPKKRYKIGIVPHYVDYEEVTKIYNGHHIIDVLNSNPLEVAYQISECEKIVSSSLHGIIAAHAYNIPAAWVEFSDKVSGDGTKFKDHFSSVSCETIKSTPSSITYQVGKYNTQKIIDALCTP